MNIGKLRHRISLQSITETQNSYGELVQTKSTKPYATVWASVEPLSGREYMDAKQINAELSHKVIIRHNSSVTPEDVVLFGSREFKIDSVINYEERGIYQVLMCKEIL